MRYCTLMVVFAALSASAKIVYVTPSGAGEKNGTSWENAYGDKTGLYDAYTNAADGATAALPGEVRMLGGWYTTPAGNIAMKPHVRVYGGFRGDETSAEEADPESNPTIISVSWYATDAEKYYWKDEKGNNAGPVWTNEGGIYTYHPVPDGVYRYAIECGTDPLFTDNGQSADGNAFIGLTITSCSRSCFHLTGADAALVRVSRCRFLGNSRYSNFDNANIYVKGGTSVLVDDCRFEGTCSPVYSSMNAADVTCVVTNCRFVSCYAKNNLAAGVMTAGAGAAEIAGCSFERSWLDANQPGLDIVAGAAHTVVRDCSFAASRAFSDYGTPCLVVGASNVKVDVERCSFTGAKSVIGRDAYSAGTCIKDQATITGSDIVIRDSYFAGNVLLAKGNQDKSPASRSYGCLYG